jgi:transposase-like protein
MRKRRKADEAARLLREADRDPAKGSTVADIGRKLGIAQATYHRWRQRHDPARGDRPSVPRTRCRGRAAQAITFQEDARRRHPQAGSSGISLGSTSL